MIIIRRFVLFHLLVISFLAMTFSCKNYHRNNSHKDVSLSSIKTGELLAIKYCQSCHLLPDPSLLDAKTWEKNVLPNMGPRLGIFHYDFETYPSYKSDKNIGPNFYPSQPVLNSIEWQNIIDYYSSTSPDSLAKQHRVHPIQSGLPTFSVQYPKFSYENPTTSFVKIQAAGYPSPLIISDVFKQNIYFFNRQLEIEDSVHCSGPIVDIDFIQNTMLTCNIGNLYPNNGKLGKGQFISIDSMGGMRENTSILFDSLRRPVQLSSADLNNDGKIDYLVCEFGNLIGALSWMENLGNNGFKQHVLRAFPGAIKTYLTDYNQDGALDIWALFSQGEEGIFLFTNKGNGDFESREVLRFPPVYGSSSFELADINNDHFPDIVYTCGDNADYSQILKPYHGVYVFLNDGKNNFTQKYFYPINGCYKAIARDFDHDGDLDIATISFFADYEHRPEESFIYLEQHGRMTFIPYTIPESKLGRWLTMDAGDIDGDGKIDLILGNFSLGSNTDKINMNWAKAPPFIVLKNIGKQEK